MKVMRAVESKLKPGYYRLFHGSKPLVYDAPMAIYSPQQVLRLAKTYHFDRIYWAETITQNSWSQKVCDSKSGNTTKT